MIRIALAFSPCEQLACPRGPSCLEKAPPVLDVRVVVIGPSFIVV